MPRFETTITPIPLSPPVVPTVGAHTVGTLAVAYTPQQQAVQFASTIDSNKLNPGRYRGADKGDNSYTIDQLKEFARGLDLRVSGNKRELVDRIRAKLRELGGAT